MPSMRYLTPYKNSSKNFGTFTKFTKKNKKRIPANVDESCLARLVVGAFGIEATVQTAIDGSRLP